MTSLLDRTIAIYKTNRIQKEVKRNLQMNLVLSIVKYFRTENKPMIDEIPETFPNIDKIMEGFINEAKKLATARKATPVNRVDVHIMIGDSLSAFFKGKSKYIDLNFGIAGASSKHFASVIRTIAPVLNSLGLNVKYITIGCFVGNALLAQQNAINAFRDADDCLALCRRTWQTARMEIYGLPPVYDLYAMQFQEVAREFFITWVQIDNNAVYLDLLAVFGKNLLFPTTEYSSDAVHMTPVSQFDFDIMIGNGRNAPPRTIIASQQKGWI